MVSRRMPVIRRILCTLLVCALLTGLLPAAFAAGSDPDFSAPADKVLISQTNYPIVNGLTESQVILNNAERQRIRCWAIWPPSPPVLPGEAQGVLSATTTRRAARPKSRAETLAEATSAGI